tara:strand:- start:818 stop:1099 length:282 start_codon:yes stop_codon:yes gene_type:complete
MGELGNFTIDQMAGSLALLLGSIGGLCLILFKSRCTQISICWGLWSCTRQVMDEEEGDVKKEDDKKKDETILPTPTPTPQSNTPVQQLEISNP